jgi:ribokinase
VVITRGERGSVTRTVDAAFCTPAFRVPVVDTTGAGDVFHGAYLFGLLQGWELDAVAEFASASAALKCTKLGGRAGIPRRTEVVDFLRERGRPVPAAPVAGR